MGRYPLRVSEQGAPADTGNDEARIAAAIERARELLTAAHAATPRRAKARAKRIGRLLETANAKALTIALTDRVMRATDDAHAARLLAEAWAAYPPGRGMTAADKLALATAAAAAPRAPHPVMARVRDRLRKESDGVVLDAAPDAVRAFHTQVGPNVTVNINVLGEAVLGDEQAAHRAAEVIGLIKLDAVHYVSVKPSAVAANPSAVAFDATVARMVAHLRPIYDAAAAHDVFVNLDMEEYKEFALTLEVFAALLGDPTLDAQPIGVVLQAYLPDSHAAFARLAKLACERRDRGGLPVKVRLVKGANLAAEHVEAEIHGWHPAPYATKAEVDASYKRLLDAALDPALAGAMRIGVASHNLFDIAWAEQCAAALDQADRLDFEMLAGMAEGEVAALRGSAPLVLYAPVTRAEDFTSALAYLVRRLDENTGPENFLRAAFTMTPTSPSFDEQAERFAAAVRARHTVTTTPRRASVPPRSADRFANAPDTDVTQPAARQALIDAQQVARLQELAPIPLRIAGTQRKGAATATGIDPSAPKGPRYTYAQADTALVDEAVACAQASVAAWDGLGAAARAAVLDRAAAIMADERARSVGIMASDAGKTLLQADAEVSEAVDFAAYYADSARSLGFAATHGITWAARGVVVIAPPWNFPYAIPAGGVLAALAAGNAVILKPAPETVWTAWHLANQLWAAGVPPTVLQFVPCPDNEVGRRLITHPDVDAVVLTGSIHTAVMFYQWRPDLYLMAETSGKNAIVITAAADIDAAVRDLVASAFGHAGQKCSAASLAIVEASVYDHPQFQRQLADATRSLRVGPAWDPSTDVGPLIAPPSETIERALTRLDADETWLVEPEARDEHGHLWSPGVRLGVEPGSFLHTTECFGPVLGVMRAPDLETAIEWQNATPFGLTGGIHSLDPVELDRWVERVEVGNAYVNRTITGAIVGRQPFGGLKASAVGPGVKAGGPEYVAALAHASDAPGVDRPAAALDSYPKGVHRLLRVNELGGLRAEHNIGAYRRPSSLAVWVASADDEALEDLGLVLTAAQHLQIPVQVFSPHTLDPTIAVRYCAPEGLAAVIDAERPEQVRAIGPVPPDAYRAAHRHNTWVNTARPVAFGPVELRHFVREQVFSITGHRSGNLDAAPLPDIVARARLQT